MLKINLLPIRQLKKRAKARNQIVAAGMVLLCIIVLLGFVELIQASRISSLNDEIAANKKQKDQFSKVVKELTELEKKRLDLNNKIKIINQLKTDSSLTVHVLDRIAKIIDNNRMWLKSMSLNGGTLSLSGLALDNQTIAQFMVMLDDGKRDELEVLLGDLDILKKETEGAEDQEGPQVETKKIDKSPYIRFSNVNLSNSSLTRVSGRELKSFALTCNISAPPESETSQPAGENAKK